MNGWHSNMKPSGRTCLSLRRLPPGEMTHVFTATPTHPGFEEYDIANQIAISRHYWLIDGQLKQFSYPHRYV